MIATDLTEPTYYVTGFQFKNDSVFGTGPMLDLDLYQLLGIENKPPGTKWTLSTDYFNLRGPALGTSYKYQGDTLFGMPGPYRGFIDAYGIHDDGARQPGPRLARPGRARSAPRPRARPASAVPARRLASSPAELGLISDRNFLEQYFEQEWDTFKDQSTGSS